MKPARLFFIPVLFVIVTGAILSVPFFFSKISNFSSLGFFSLVEERSKEVFTNFKTGELLKGEKIQGEFISSENNLGIVLLRFSNYKRISSDKVIFRIRNSLDHDWYYENKYNVDQFQPDQYFTFGFPAVRDSKGKGYRFEIESLSGKPFDAIGLSAKPPQLALSYQFSKEDLSKKENLLRFIFKKSIYAAYSLDKKVLSFVYLVSLGLVFLWEKKKVFYMKFYKLWIYFYAYFLRFEKKNKKRLQVFKNLFVNLSNFIELSKIFFLAKHKKFFPILHILIIFFVAFLNRVSVYLNPKNFEELMFSQIGGFGDYDQLFRHTFRFMLDGKNFDNYYWSLMDDYVVNMRLFAIFFKLFGFVKGLDYVEYFLIFLSSVICLLPFLLFSRFKRFSLGGFIASLFLAVNPLFTWLASARPLDILTLFFFSLFIILFILSLEKRNFLLASLLGIIGFVDVLNRGLMMLNDFPALLLFAIFFLYNQKSFSVDFSLFRSRLKDLLYAFFPLLAFGIIYFWWSNYYFKTFNLLWFFAPQNLVTKWNPINDPENILGRWPVEKLFHYLLQFHVALDRIPRFMFVSVYIDKIPKVMLAPMLIFLGLSLVIFLLLKTKRNKYLKILSAPFVYLVFLYFLQSLFKVKSLFDFDLSRKSIRYFLDLKLNNFVTFFTFLQLLFLQIIFLKKEFFKYFIVIVVYLFVLGYGIYHHFYERHYIQVIIPFFILFGLTVDKLFISSFSRKNFVVRKIAILYIVGIFIFLVGSIIQNTWRFALGVNHFRNQVGYLEQAKTFIPEDGIILADMRDGENFIWVYKHTKRSVVFSISNGEPDLFSYKDQKTNKFYEEIINKNFNIEKALQNEAIFKKYNFYILDYNVPRWRNILTNKDSGHPFFPKYVDKFELKQIADVTQRPIYQLVLKGDGN